MFQSLVNILEENIPLFIFFAGMLVVILLSYALTIFFMWVGKGSDMTYFDYQILFTAIAIALLCIYSISAVDFVDFVMEGLFSYATN